MRWKTDCFTAPLADAVVTVTVARPKCCSSGPRCVSTVWMRDKNLVGARIRELAPCRGRGGHLDGVGAALLRQQERDAAPSCETVSIVTVSPEAMRRDGVAPIAGMYPQRTSSEVEGR